MTQLEQKHECTSLHIPNTTPEILVAGTGRFTNPSPYDSYVARSANPAFTLAHVARIARDPKRDNGDNRSRIPDRANGDIRRRI